MCAAVISPCWWQIQMVLLVVGKQKQPGYHRLNYSMAAPGGSRHMHPLTSPHCLLITHPHCQNICLLLDNGTHDDGWRSLIKWAAKRNKLHYCPSHVTVLLLHRGSSSVNTQNTCSSSHKAPRLYHPRSKEYTSWWSP